MVFPMRNYPLAALLGGLSLLLIISMSFAVACGPVSIPLLQVWWIRADHLTGCFFPYDKALSAADSIVWQIRLPRVLLGALVGAGLAVTGAVLQGITRNKLADPHLLGVSSGAAMGAVLVLLHLGMILGGVTLPLGAFLGALGATAVIALLSGHDTGHPDRLILLGVAVSFVFGALNSLLIFVADHRAAHVVLFWLLGGLGAAKWSDLWLPGAALATALPILFFHAPHLNALMAGEETAVTLGIDVAPVRRRLFVVTALLTGALVAFSGVIGFVGLMVPHFVRRIVGADHHRVLPLSSVCGAVFLIWADVPARTMLSPDDLPIGIVTSLTGGAFFIWITLHRPGRRDQPR